MSRGARPWFVSPASARAARANDNGAAFESFLSAQHKVARRLGLAKIRHVSPKVRWTGSGARVRVKVVGDAGADYAGTIRPGRSFVGEAKSTEDERLVRSALEPHQIEDLDDCVALGGLGVLLVELHVEQRPRRFAAPWPAPWRERGRGASLGVEELAPWEMQPGELYLRRFIADLR